MSAPDAPRGGSRILEELQQRRPFRSPAQEAAVALMRTSWMVARAITRVVEPEGISVAQYNVLRILRGAGPEGLPTLGIRERLIEENAAITRLVDKLEQAGLVRRERTREDRRQVLCYITDDGLATLARLDEPVEAAIQHAMAPLDEPHLRELLAALDAIRGTLTEHPGA